MPPKTSAPAMANPSQSQARTPLAASYQLIGSIQASTPTITDREARTMGLYLSMTEERQVRTDNSVSGSSCAAAWPRDPLRGCRVCDELGGRPTRSGHEFTTAIGTLAGEHRARTGATVGALERTDHDVGRIDWQIAIATFAVRAQLKHRQLLAETNWGIVMLLDDHAFSGGAQGSGATDAPPAATAG
jgi:hypothetical protein